MPFEKATAGKAESMKKKMDMPKKASLEPVNILLFNVILISFYGSVLEYSTPLSENLIPQQTLSSELLT